jgi:alpha-beta hydrolase superfamily lysophospholipase
MTDPQKTEWTFDGAQGQIHAQSWSGEDAPTHVVLLVHGYGEHIGRYDHVADALIAGGAVVYGMDHMGHGKSDGDRAIVTDFDEVVADVDAVVDAAGNQNPDLPVVMIGHSMGGLIASRYAQTHGDRLAALVLSGPAIGRSDLIEQLLALEEIPDIPLDPEVLSRDDAVGAAYAADPLVWHGPFQRPMLEAMSRANKQTTEGGSIGDLPLLWVHGADDQLVPIDGSAVGFESLKGTNAKAVSYPGARHEIFNETNKDEVLADVTGFIAEVLAG